MGKHYILVDKKPKSVDLITWAKWFEKADRHVAKDDIGEVRVSTIFLGLDHNFNDEGTPILFETMVFEGKLHGEQERYCTWKEAEEGHKVMVKRVLKAEK